MLFHDPALQLEQILGHSSIFAKHTVIILFPTLRCLAQRLGVSLPG